MIGWLRPRVDYYWTFLVQTLFPSRRVSLADIEEAARHAPPLPEDQIAATFYTDEEFLDHLESLGERPEMGEIE